MKIALVLLNGFIAKERMRGFTPLGRMGAYAPTTLTTLASLVPKELRADIEIIDEFVTPFDPNTVAADLVGLSFTTPNAVHAYSIAAVLRKRNITVVMGGYHVSAVPNESSQHADSVVVGFAEKSWPQLLRDFVTGNLQQIYRGSFESDFASLRVTEFDLLRKKKYFYPYTIEFSRSCANSCKFCVIPNFSGKTLSYRGQEAIADDIRRMKGKDVVLLDSSPAENIAQFKELCHLLKELKIRWYTAITCKLASQPSVVELMAESGCRGVFIGFETFKQETLRDQKKPFNHPEDYKEFIRALHNHGIYVFGSFVFGFDEDDETVFDATVDFVDKCAIDMAHYAILTPFPGTGLFEDLHKQKRITTYDWSKYDGLHTTFLPDRMTSERLQSGFKYAYLKTHSLRSITKRMMHSPCRSKTLFFGNLSLGMYGRKVLQ